MPEHAKVPLVVTVHDLTFFDHPEWHERTKVLVFRRAIRVAARRSTALLCDSRRTAERLEELCHPAGRVFVIPLGVDLDRFRPSVPANDDASTLPDGSSADVSSRAGRLCTQPSVSAPDTAGTFTDVGRNDEDLLASLGVREPYVLFLGTLEPRKAVPELVAAFDVLARRDSELSLVLAGKPGWGAQEVDRQIACARHGDRVMRVGYVDDDAVPALLRRAAVVAYPAKEEGFGLPALEALACGAPLVTTSSTVMADLAGNAALTVAAGSVGDLADALGTTLRGEGVAERRRLGLEVASRYSWEASADAHVLAYRWATDQPHSLLRWRGLS
jgi:glycosyltransferase involved in cell wall biosynthesis